ncbi:MAG: trypsin-like peptidase domain-containing protein [Thermoguttaceae bacterium]
MRSATMRTVAQSPAPSWRTAIAVVLVLAAVCGSATAPNKALADPRTPEAAPAVPVPQDLGELKAIEESIKQVAARVLPCTVVVRIGPSQGSGVVVSSDGYVLSAGHVVGKPGQKAVFLFPDGKTANGTTLGVNRDTDAGLLKIGEPGTWPFVPMRKRGTIRPGTWCLALGHPLGPQEGRPPVVRAGRVLQTQPNLLRTDCMLVAGDSGGPLVDLEGKLIGINSRINAPIPTMNFHVSIDAFHDSWEQLLKGELIESTVPGKDSNEVKDLLRQVAAEAHRCVVRVKCEGQDVALGTIVGPDGWILTKASQLKGRPLCRTPDGQEHQARLVGVHEGFDLAMLKIEVSGLPSIPWAADSQPAVGQWLATVGPASDRPLGLGVVGVPPRRIPPISGVLGVALEEGDKPARILNVFPGSAAQKAGLQPNDIITHLNDEPMNSRAKLVAALKTLRPGTTVKLTVKRGDQTLHISATLSVLQTPGSRRRDMQNLAGLGVSARHDDFPKVLQHDGVVAPTDCGGPLVDLSGRVVGVNIARAGRTETYAVPADVLLGLMYDLMSGRLAPAQADKKPAGPVSKLPKPAEPKPAKPKPAEPPSKQAKPSQPEPPVEKPSPPKAPEPNPPEPKPQAPEAPEAKPPAAKPAEAKPAEPGPGQPIP